jgi:hypothetical protein
MSIADQFLIKFKLNKKQVSNTILNNPQLISQMNRDGQSISNIATGMDGHKYYVNNRPTKTRAKVVVSYREDYVKKTNIKYSKKQTLAILRALDQMPHGDALIKAMEQYYGNRANTVKPDDVY